MLRSKILVIVGLLSFGCAHAQSEGGRVGIERAFPNVSFDRPVDIQHAGDGSDRLFVIEQAGIIRVFANDPEVANTEVFLDIRDRVRSNGSEEGLLGLAFHPDYASNGFFYVNYTASNPRRTVVSRFEVEAANPDQADPASEQVILEVAQPFGNHNGGQVRFGPDGYLYIALGDGGDGGDPQGNGQNRSTLLGSILRIDVNTPSGDMNYSIPPDNPFVGAMCGTVGCREEIYAYGLRNPWRFSFDRATGDLWTADVGQNAFEEIDIITAGGNYGWDVMEAAHCFEPPSGCDTDGLILPIWEYGRSQGRSITGGFVYRGTAVPELIGQYVYADFVSGRVWTLAYEDGTVVSNTELQDTDLNIATFGEDEAGELYFSAFDGHLYRFVSDMGSATRDVPERSTVVLAAPFPNPFRFQTTLVYTLSRPTLVQIDVYNVLGRRIRTLVDRVQMQGQHEVSWDGEDAAGAVTPAGVYVAHVKVDHAPPMQTLLVKQ